MPTHPDNAYLTLKADDRMEVRLPAVLKQHAALVASARQQNVSEFVLGAVADAVDEGMAEVGTWKLTIPEQQELLQLLTQSATHTPAMTVARERVDHLFGPSALE